MKAQVYGFLGTNTGDNNSTTAVYNGLGEDRIEKRGLLKLEQLQAIVNDASQDQNTPYRLIVTSVEGAEAVNRLDTIPRNVKIFWTGHQTNEALTTAVEAGKIDSVYIASSGISNVKTEQYKRRCEVVKLPGVPATIDREFSKREYETHKASLLPLAEGQSRIVVFFGGDAPKLEDEPGEKFGYITKDDAAIIGQQLADFARQNNAVVEICTGPRTGQRDPGTNGQENFSHDKFHPETGDLVHPEAETGYIEDETSQGLREGLEGVSFKIHPFHWGNIRLRTPEAKAKAGNAPKESMYDALMGAVLAEPNAIPMFTAESVTEGNKFAGYLVGKGFAIRVPSMNEGHENFIEGLNEKGYIGIIDPVEKTVTSPGQREGKIPQPLDVVTKLVSKMEKKMVSPEQGKVSGFGI